MSKLNLGFDNSKSDKNEKIDLSNTQELLKEKSEYRVTKINIEEILNSHNLINL